MLKYGSSVLIFDRLSGRRIKTRETMVDTDNIIEVGEDNFDLKVRGKSKEVPVLVDFWAPWCAPCRMLTPILQKLAKEYDGKFVLATVNTDDNPRLALDHRIRSLPTVKLFRHGEPVEEFFGMQAEGVIRLLLDRHIERGSDRLVQSADAAWARGERQTALQTMREALGADPGNERIHPELARLLIDLGEYDEAAEILRRLSLSRQQDPDIAPLDVLIKFGRIAKTAPEEQALERAIGADPDNCEARYQLSAKKVMRRQFEPALAQLIEIIKRDRRFGEDAGRKALLDIFTLLGGQAPLVKHYRSLLATALH